jgi:hypothetical protein
VKRRRQVKALAVVELAEKAETLKKSVKEQFEKFRIQI